MGKVPVRKMDQQSVSDSDYEDTVTEGACEAERGLIPAFLKKKKRVAIGTR